RERRQQRGAQDGPWPHHGEQRGKQKVRRRQQCDSSVAQPKSLARPPFHRSVRLSAAEQERHPGKGYQQLQAAAHRARSHGGRRCFWTFPRAVRGNLSTTTNARGILKDAKCRRHADSRAPQSASPRTTTQATGTSPRRASGTPATATSATPLCSARNSSISRG